MRKPCRSFLMPPKKPPGHISQRQLATSPRCGSCIPPSKVSGFGSRRAGPRPKAAHIEKNPKVQLFYQVGPEFVHLTVTGSARFIEDAAEKQRVWEGKVFDYDLAQFWPGGHQMPDFGLMLVTPSRIELTSLTEMMQRKKPLVWRENK